MEEHDSQIDDFIGWKSEDGKLEVVGVEGRDKQGVKLYKVTCTECSKDEELFPDGYFVNNKGNLVRGNKPCGCSKCYKWTKNQYLILTRRIGEKKGFIVHGFAEDFKGSTTKLNLRCIKCKYQLFPTVNNFINNGTGCSRCKGNYKPTEKEALEKCNTICKIEDYEPIGFPEGYKNQRSRFEYVCQKHGKQNVSYNAFVNMGTRCLFCWEEKRPELIRVNGNRNGYYSDRTTEQDFLYVLNFNNKFIKVGRSFDVKRRISQLKQESKIKNIKKLCVLIGTHQEIYDLEQELHNELRERGFNYNVDWSTECFDNNSLDFIKYFIQKSGLKTVG